MKEMREKKSARAVDEEVRARNRADDAEAGCAGIDRRRSDLGLSTVVRVCWLHVV